MRIFKYSLVVLLVVALAFSACRKHSNAVGPVSGVDYFIFGKVGGFCPTVCAKYYKLQGNQLFQTYVDSTDQVKYLPTPMPSDKYALALPAFNDFPDYFNAHPNMHIGCSNCADIGYLYFEYKKAQVVYKWTVDYPYDSLPTEIKPYMDQVNGIMDNLQ